MRKLANLHDQPIEIINIPIISMDQPYTLHDEVY